jgi:hypothetical protein
LCRERELVHALGPEGASVRHDALNERAVAVIRRVQVRRTLHCIALHRTALPWALRFCSALVLAARSFWQPRAFFRPPPVVARVCNRCIRCPPSRPQAKLVGTDFGTDEPLPVAEQVQRLIRDATAHENLCRCYIGWCPFW